MIAFVDTSAFYSLLDHQEARHDQATRFVAGLDPDDDLVSHSYVVLETTSIVQNRLGARSVRALLVELLPLVHLVWVDSELHGAGVTALLAAGGRRVSLVDWVSFELMRRRGIETAFTFDEDFRRQGFRTVP